MTDEDVVTIFICGVGDGISYNRSSSNIGPLLVILIFILVGGVDVVTIFVCGDVDGILYNGSSSNKGPLLVILIIMLVGGVDVSCTECLSVKGPLVNSVVTIFRCDSISGFCFVSQSLSQSLSQSVTIVKI